jgi:hypothetical protein
LLYDGRPAVGDDGLSKRKPLGFSRMRALWSHPRKMPGQVPILKDYSFNWQEYQPQTLVFFHNQPSYK